MDGVDRRACLNQLRFIMKEYVKELESEDRCPYCNLHPPLHYSGCFVIETKLHLERAEALIRWEYKNAEESLDNES